MMEESLEVISEFIDDLWKLKGPLYTKPKMESFLDILSNEIVTLVATLMAKVIIIQSQNICVQ